MKLINWFKSQGQQFRNLISNPAGLLLTMGLAISWLGIILALIPAFCPLGARLAKPSALLAAFLTAIVLVPCQGAFLSSFMGEQRGQQEPGALRVIRRMLGDALVVWGAIALATWLGLHVLSRLVIYDTTNITVLGVGTNVLPVVLTIRSARRAGNAAQPVRSSRATKILGGIGWIALIVSALVCIGGLIVVTYGWLGGTQILGIEVDPLASIYRVVGVSAWNMCAGYIAAWAAFRTTGGHHPLTGAEQLEVAARALVSAGLGFLINALISGPQYWLADQYLTGLLANNPVTPLLVGRLLRACIVRAVSYGLWPFINLLSVWINTGKAFEAFRRLWAARFRRVEQASIQPTPEIEQPSTDTRSQETTRQVTPPKQGRKAARKKRKASRRRKKNQRRKHR